jgi:hypothetical protein
MGNSRESKSENCSINTGNLWWAWVDLNHDLALISIAVVSTAPRNTGSLKSIAACFIARMIWRLYDEDRLDRRMKNTT